MNGPGEPSGMYEKFGPLDHLAMHTQMVKIMVPQGTIHCLYTDGPGDHLCIDMSGPPTLALPCRAWEENATSAGYAHHAFSLMNIAKHQVHH